MKAVKKLPPVVPSVPEGLRTALLRFYRAHRRDLPWRRSRDPYAIWVSEIMLQQTQVDTVVPRYAQFLAQFPSVSALAAAEVEQVCEAWAGLGYYRRARHLHAAARQVVQEHAGTLPPEVTDLLTLPGIGRYTAGAIASIAYGRAAPLVDGNVVRVLSRIFALDAAPQSGPGKLVLWALATELVQGTHPGDLNQALMELGATVCTPAGPQCATCPARAFCAAYQAGEPTRYPTPTVKAARQELRMAMVYAQNDAGVWLARRPLDGLWAGLWELPSASGEAALADLTYALGQKLGKLLATVTHELTHRHVVACIYRVARPRLTAGLALRPYADPLAAPLSALARKAILAAKSTLPS